MGLRSGIIVLLKEPFVPKFQMSSWWFEVMLKNSEVVLLVSFTSCNLPVPLAAKQPPGMMLPPPSLTVGTVFLGLNSLLSLLQTYLWSAWPNNSSFVSSDHKTLKLFCQFGQLQTLVKLEIVSFGTGASSLDGSLSVHGNIRFTSL